VNAGFSERLFFDALARNPQSLPMRVIMNGEIVPEERARRIVEAARLNGWIPSSNLSREGHTGQ
jgi:hypothetical protein